MRKYKSDIKNYGDDSIRIGYNPRGKGSNSNLLVGKDAHKIADMYGQQMARPYKTKADAQKVVLPLVRKFVGKYSKHQIKYKIQCTNCEMKFKEESDLILLPDGQEFYKACPICKTDGHLKELYNYR